MLIDNELLVDEGRFLEAEIRALLASGAWPARRPDRNISDLKAQVAACARGAAEMRRVAGEYGREVDRRLYGPRPGQCRGGGPAADRPPERRRLPLRDGQWRRASASRSGSIRRAARRSSTSPAPAPSSPTISTRLIRSAGPRRSTSSGPWSTTSIPMNDGCLRPITLVVPEGSMLNPRYPGRGRRRQCRDQPGDHRRFVRRLPGARAEPGDDEQFHLRQRAPSIL